MRGRAGTFQITGPVILVAALFLSAPNVNGQVAQAQKEDLHRMPVVVVLHSYHHGYTWTDNISDGIRAAFAASGKPVDLRFEFLDSRRIASEAYFEDLRRLLQTKYAVWESCLGHGIVGGKITSGREEGRMVAELVQRIIGGERASDIPLSSSPTRFMFDWRELDRFGIGENELPAGSVVVGRPESFFGEHQGMFLTIAAVFAALVLLVVGLVANTFRRRRAEAMQARFAAILGTTTDFVAMATYAGEITYLNPAGRRLVGWDEDTSLEGKHIRDIHPKSARRLIGSTAVPVALRDGVWAGETLVTHRDGYEIPVSQVILANRSARGEIEFMSTIMRDLRPRIETEETLRAIEEHLQHSRKMEAIGQLAGGVAHDFNNLLMAIMGNADLLTVMLPQGSREAGRAQEILAASEKAAAVTRQLLTFSRKGSFKTQLVDLRVVVDSVIGLLGRSIDRRIEIERRVEGETATVMGDPSQIESAVLNLAVNARDAMPDGGKLVFNIGRARVEPESVAARSEELEAGDYVEVVVSDSGVGIPKKLQDKIFDPFFTTKGPGQGTGLGLSTAYGCVRNHHGRITVHSEPGEGSEFRILLPLAHCVADADSDTGEPRGLVTGEGHILVVDDEAMVREVVGDSLENLGYTVTTCCDGEEALQRYQSDGAEIDLVILDLIMPKINGADVFYRLREMDPEVRVVLSSGFSPDAESQHLLEEGALGFMVKPFGLRELAETVSLAISAEPE